MAEEKVLDLEHGGVFKATDPVMANVATPTDFAAQFPQPLDPTEIIAMCEEITLWRTIPDQPTGLKSITWRELNELAFTSGSSYIGFADGACPEEYYHDGDNTTVNLKNVGVKKSLTLSDIKHSLAVQAAGYGIQNLLGGWASGEGQPGAADVATFAREQIAGLKAKEVRLGMTLVLNGIDRLMAVGDLDTYPYEFDGIEQLVTAAAGAQSNTGTSTMTGTFDADYFDEFIGEGCAKPTHIFGHPAAIQYMLSDYFQLGFQGSQIISMADGNRVIPGFNFAGFVNTGIGRLTVVADTNFTRTNVGGGKFSSSLYALRMVHNGEPLVFRTTQFPLSLTDLAPGCTAVSFEIWAKMALIVKAMCAQKIYTAWFGTGKGSIQTTCTKIG